MRSKKIIALIIALLFLVACVPTPEIEYVANKAEGHLDSLIAESLPVEQYEIRTDGVPQGEARTLKSCFCFILF